MTSTFSELNVALREKLKLPVTTTSSHTTTLLCMKSCGLFGWYGCEFLPDIRNARLAPLADHARAIWAQLRQESNVELGAITLSGARTRRDVDLNVTVDGSPGHGRLPGLGDAEDRRYFAMTIPPQVFVNLVADHVIVHRMFPLAADRTLVECDWLYSPDVVAGFWPEHTQSRAATRSMDIATT